MNDNNNNIYKEVEPSVIPIAKKEQIENFSTKYKADYHLATNDFWRKTFPEVYNDYINGYYNGSFNKNELIFSKLLNNIFLLIKEILTQQCKKNNNLSIDELKENFIMIETSLKLLNKNLSTQETELNNNILQIAAFIQGYFNAYINGLVQEKLKQEGKR